VIAENSLVVLKEDRPADGLCAGDVGALVHVYGRGEAYEVEFVEGDGATVAVLTLKADNVRPIDAREVLHARRRN
jgi:hypothetical protein